MRFLSGDNLLKVKSDIFFPFGAHFYREPSRNLEELKHDMLVLKKLGFNMLKFQESWSFDERIEGEVNIDKITELVEEAEKIGLYIYFGVTMEQAPAWLWEKYPDCRMAYSTGEKHNEISQYLLPADGKPGPCWDHPGAREAGSRFIGEVTRRLSRYDNILVWDIWQEIGFYPTSSLVGFCFCPYTLSRFKEWLYEKYGDLNSLNRAWRTGYGKWEEVEPPRLFPMVPSFIDWRYFMDDIFLARTLRWKAEAFRTNDPKKRPILSHVCTPTLGRGVEWRWAVEGDIFGSSCYPAWFPFHEWDASSPVPGKPVSYHTSFLKEIQLITLNFDYIRSVSGATQQIWAAEFQGGPVVDGLHKGRVPSKEDIRRWVLAALSSGIKGLSFWNHRAEIFWLEAYGFGLLDTRGDSSPRAEEAGHLAQALNHHADLFVKGHVPKNEVAILVNEGLWLFAQATWKDIHHHLSYTIRGIYMMLWEAGIWVDFVESSETTLEELKRYKVLILPFPLALNDDVFDMLKKYVDSGGTLVSEACPGRYDHFGFARPGELSAGAEELFGVEQESLKLCHEPKQPPRWTPKERSYGEVIPATRFKGTGTFKGYSVLPSLYVQTFNTKFATPILRCSEKVSGVVNDFGKGKAYLIGTFIGHAGSAFEDKDTADFLLTVLKKTGVKPECYGRLYRRRRVTEDSQAWFFFNMNSKPVVEQFGVDSFSRVEDLLGGSLTVRSGDVSVKVDPYTIRCLIMKQ